MRLIVLLGLMALVGCGMSNPGDGEKIGQIVRVTHEGVICKTYEAQMIRGGMSNGSGGFGTTPFHFTIDDEKTADQLRKYMADQVEILIKYRTRFIYPLCSSESGGAFLTSIEPVKKS